MASPGSLSACIVTYNEADRIEACLRSVSFCDEVIVVDSHSNDATRELAAALGARVIERDWPGYRSQKEFAVDAASNDWCARLATACEQSGFILLEGQALAYVPIDFADEDSYLARLSSGRRKDIRRKLRKREPKVSCRFETEPGQRESADLRQVAAIMPPKVT